MIGTWAKAKWGDSQPGFLRGFPLGFPQDCQALLIFLFVFGAINYRKRVDDGGGSAMKYDMPRASKRGYVNIAAITSHADTSHQIELPVTATHTRHTLLEIQK